MSRRIYMDHAATTPCDPAVIESMLPYLHNQFGNPSGLYAEGRIARRAVDDARDRTAQLLGANSPAEIVFTSSGSEADNLALKGAAWAARDQGLGAHIVVTAFEHHAVLHTAQALEKQGFSVTYIRPDQDGLIHPWQVNEAFQSNTTLVSVMLANNEIGTVQPLGEIASVCRQRGVLLHTDAVQAVGHIPIDVGALGVDMLSLSAHKFYGPKGVGALYVRKGVHLASHTHGGGQELERRAGTENVSGVVGLAKALEVSLAALPDSMNRMQRLRDALIEGVLSEIDDARLNGHPTHRLPGNAHFSFAGVDGESLLLNLDMHGIAASAGSACSAGSVEPSYVLSAMGVERDLASRALRLTLGRQTELHEVEYVVSTLQSLVKRLRNIKNNTGVQNA